MLLSLSVSALPIPAAVLDSISLFRYTQPVRMELLLPMEGPGSAILNPARATDARRLYMQYGTRNSGDSRAMDLSLGGGFGGKYFVGAFFSGANERFDFTNALILDNRVGLQAAYRHPLEGEGSISIGIALALNYVDGMGAFKFARATPDFGFLYVPTSRPGGWLLEWGMAARDLRSFEEKAPEHREPPQPHTSEVRADFAPG